MLRPLWRPTVTPRTVNRKDRSRESNVRQIKDGVSNLKIIYYQKNDYIPKNERRERSELLYFESSTPEKESENGEEKNDLMMCHYDVREERRRRVCEREEEGGAFVVHG
jgi:hypothetical protein